MNPEQKQAEAETVDQSPAEESSEAAVEYPDSGAESAADNAVEDQASSGDEDLSAELAKAQATVKDYWDQILRLNAEIENNRRRAQRDIEHAHKYAVKQFVESLLPVTDSLEMGMSAAQNDNATLDSIREGMQMTFDMFVQTLEKNGIQQVDPTGQPFDPELHQAMTLQESADHAPNTVIQVMQKGYVLNQRLIRPAMVVVSKTTEGN